MSVATLERSIWREAQLVLDRPKLKLKDIMEWSTGEIKPQPGEEVHHLPGLQVNIAIKTDAGK